MLNLDFKLTFMIIENDFFTPNKKHFKYFNSKHIVLIYSETALIVIYFNNF